MTTSPPDASSGLHAAIDATAAADGFADLTFRKTLLEAAMRLDPLNAHLRATYLLGLRRLCRTGFGLVAALLPEIATPLLIRAGGSDVYNFGQTFMGHRFGATRFDYGDYGWGFSRPPRRILDLGAYVGYSAVYFANRFPAAEILAIEASATSVELLRANTAAYRNITVRHAAVWTADTAIGQTGHLLGDWGTLFGGPPGADPIQARTIATLLRDQGWDSVDVVKSVVEGVDAAVLTSGDRFWAERVDTVITKLFRQPGGPEAVAAVLPPDRFAQAQPTFELTVFQRRDICASPDIVTIRLLAGPPHDMPFRLTGVADESYDFYRFGEDGLQIPAATTTPVTLSFDLLLSGQSQFHTRMAAVGGNVGLVLRLTGPDGAEVIAAGQQVRPGDLLNARLPFGTQEGPHSLTFLVSGDPAGRLHLFDPRLG